MGLKQVFEKQGGIKLLKQYRDGGALLTTVGEFLLLGKSNTALEILRLSAQMKIKNKLNKKYRHVLLDFDREYNKKTYEHNIGNKIWVCWFQGIEKAPDLVKRCIQSLSENMPDREIVIITSRNMGDYVTFPDYIMERWQCGEISNTHMTDLLRLELLIRYGGMWLDATVYCSSPNIPDYFFNSDLFFYQCLKPGKDGHANYVSSWLISAKTNNIVLMAVRELCYTYWKENNRMWDYFLLHDFMCIALEYYKEVWQSVVPRDNAAPHILLLRLFEQYDDKVWQAIKQQTPFHKLSYKFSEEMFEEDGTFYEKIIR